MADTPTKCCEICIHFVPRTPKKTPVEAYEEDTRPEPVGFFQKLAWFWNPQAWRRPEPDEWDLALSEAIKEDNANGGHCHRFPNSVWTTRDHLCGEFNLVGE